MVECTPGVFEVATDSGEEVRVKTTSVHKSHEGGTGEGAPSGYASTSEKLEADMGMRAALGPTHITSND